MDTGTNLMIHWNGNKGLKTK